VLEPQNSSLIDYVSNDKICYLPGLCLRMSAEEALCVRTVRYLMVVTHILS
jgi:hypothetical protein